MGKLAVFMAMKRDLAFEFERELRAVRNAIVGVTRISGSEYTIDLATPDGFLAGSRARAAFTAAFHASIHDALVRYAHELAQECLEHGMDPDVVGSALGGLVGPERREPIANMAPEGQAPVRFAVCA